MPVAHIKKLIMMIMMMELLWAPVMPPSFTRLGVKADWTD